MLLQKAVTKTTSLHCLSGDATHLPKPAHQLLYQMGTFYLACSATAVRQHLYFPLNSTLLVVFMLLSRLLTYIEVFCSSPAPHCSVLSSQAFPIPSPLIHFKAFILAVFNIKSHREQPSLWRKKGGLDLHKTPHILTPAPTF